MKKSILLVLSIALSVCVYAEKIKSDIKEVTVYRNQAKVQRSTTVSLHPGINEIVITDLTNQALQQTLQVGMNAKATLLSANYKVNHLSDIVQSDKIKTLNDSLDLIKNQLNEINYQKAVFNGEIEVIKKNTKLGSEEDGITVAELQELSNFYRNRLGAIEKAKFDLDLKAKTLREDQNRIKTWLRSNGSSRKKPTGEITLQIESDIARRVTIHFSYVTNGAGWSPLYDIRSEDIDSDVELIYKANVYQNTGYDWNNINLTISTGNPSQNNNQPNLSTLYTDFYRESVYYREPSYGLYKAEQAATRGMDNKLFEKEELEEVRLDVVDISANLEVQTVVSQLATAYKISNKQKIPSDGNAHLVKMKEEKVATSYNYYAVPKLDQSAFLMAKVTDWGKLNLLSGEANIFFDGMYIGQMRLDPNAVEDTLLISMGKDPGVSIKRTQLNDFSSKKLIGLNRKETLAYEIEVKNNKQKAVSIQIMDQVPVSRNKDIQVELDEKSGATYNDVYGELKWMKDLEPGKSEKFKFIYTVKYPKNKKVVGKK